MKKILASSILMVACFAGFAQQDPMFTQHMFNKMAVNPGYAGAREMLSAVALYRNQWNKIVGGPQTATFAIHSPLMRGKIGLGLYVVSDHLGVTDQTDIYANYAYRIQVGKRSILSAGISAGMRNYKEALTTLDPIDPNDSRLQNDINIWRPNFGFGLYMYSDHYFVGASIPHLLQSKLYDADVAMLTDSARQFRHLFITGGVAVPLHKNFVLRPAVLFKMVRGNVDGYTYNAPIEFDFDLHLLMYQRLWLGAAYRTGDSFDLMAEFEVSPQWLIGYSYDITSSDLTSYTGGAHEIILRYEANFKGGDRVLTPRFMRYF